MADREFLLRIVGDVSSASKSLGNLETDVNKFKDTTKVALGAVGGYFALDAAVDFGKGIANAASDQEQAIGAVNSVFGEYADTIHNFGKESAGSIGVARSEFEQLSTLTGALLKNAGVPLDEVTDSTLALTQVGADLSAMYGGSVVDSMNAINSALKGEMDPLESFGVSLKASAIEAKAVSMGLVDAEGKATDYGKKMATVALIQEQSADATGTFAKESKSMAGQTQILGAQFKDLQADLGQKLLPTIVEVSGVLVKLVTFIADNQSWLLPMAAAIGAIVLGFKAWTLATQAWEAATKIASGVQLAFNAVMAANPIVLVVLAVAALIAAFVLLYMKVDWFREFVDKAVKEIVEAFEWFLDLIKKVYNWIKDNWPLLLAIITGPFGMAVYIIQRNWDTIKQAASTVIESIKGFFNALPAFFTGIVRDIGNALSSVWDTITRPFRTAKDEVVRTMDRVLDWFYDLPGNIGNAFAYLADAIYGPFESAFRAIKNFWNNTVGGFRFEVPGWIPGVGGKGFSIPRMAKGGLVTGPTIALLGEAGREAVVPLDRAGILGSVTINVYALTANAEVGRRVYEALREFERTNGSSFDSAPSGGLSVFVS